MKNLQKATIAISVLALAACGGAGSPIETGGPSVPPEGGAQTFEALAALTSRDEIDELDYTPDGGVPLTGTAVYRGYAIVGNYSKSASGSDNSRQQPTYVAIGRSTVTADFAAEEGELVADKFNEIDLEGVADFYGVSTASLSATAIEGSITGTISDSGDSFGGTLTKSDGSDQAYNFAVTEIAFYGDTGEQVEINGFGDSPSEPEVAHGFYSFLKRED